MPNLFIIYVLFIGLFASRTIGTIYGVAVGLILDLLFGMKVGLNAVTLGVVGVLAGVFDKKKKRNKKSKYKS